MILIKVFFRANNLIRSPPLFLKFFNWGADKRQTAHDGLRPRPHVSGCFLIRGFFFPDSKISTPKRIRIQIEFARPTRIRIHSGIQDSSGILITEHASRLPS